MLKFVSLDIETSGTDPNQHQILEFGAVYEDYGNVVPSSELPKFHAYIKWKTIVGSPYALAMNARCLEKISGRVPLCKGERLLTPEEFCAQFYGWLEDYISPERYDKIWFTAAGKNAGGFDLRFLSGLDAWRSRFGVRKRVLDPGSVCVNPMRHDVLPDLQGCIEGVGLSEVVSHHALDDALNVVRILRRHYLGTDGDLWDE